MAILRIFLTETPPEASADLAWELLDPAGKLLQAGFDPLAKMPVAEQCQAVAPAAVVLLTSVKLPAGKAAQIRRLLPFAVEEQLAVETDSVHIALAASLVEGLQPVAVVDKNWTQQSLAILSAAGLQVQQLFPATLLLPQLAEGWAVSWEGERGFVRTGQYAGLALEGTGIPFALQRLCQLTPPKQIQLYGDADAEAWAAQLGVSVVQSPFEQTRILSALDLLQGSFSRQQFNWSWLAKLKPVLWLGTAMILLQLLGTGIVDWRLAREQQQLRSAMEADFRLAFPEATMVVDPVLQMERQLAALRRTAGIADAQDFLPLLGKITPLLTTASGTQLQKIYFENKILKLVLGLPTLSALEALHSQTSHLACQTSWQADGLTVQLKVWECL